MAPPDRRVRGKSRDAGGEGQEVKKRPSALRTSSTSKADEKSSTKRVKIAEPTKEESKGKAAANAESAQAKKVKPAPSLATPKQVEDSIRRAGRAAAAAAEASKKKEKDHSKTKEKAEKPIVYVPLVKKKVDHLFGSGVTTPPTKRKAPSTSSMSSSAKQKLEHLKNTLEPSPEADASEEDEDEEAGDEESDNDDCSASDGGDKEDEEAATAMCSEEEGDESPDGEEGEGPEEEDEGEDEQSSQDDEGEEEDDDPVALDKFPDKVPAAKDAEPAKPKPKLRNSVTNKREWDSFVRSNGRFKVHDFYQNSKLECFNMWLDCGKSWDAVALQVKRKHEEETESSRGWIAKQGRTLKEEKGAEKAAKIMQARRNAGMYYEDEDFPGDEDELSLSCSNVLCLIPRFLPIICPIEIDPAPHLFTAEECWYWVRAPQQMTHKDRTKERGC